jgi:genome maintenance exonuclease 1
MANLIPLKNQYTYERLNRIETPNGRMYHRGDDPPVYSVTNILDKTKDKTSLNAWAARIGAAEAERIKTEAAHVGTAMHLVIEKFLERGVLPPAEDWLQMRGYEMGHRLINAYFSSIDEVWGSEVPLYFPGKYAGTTDMVGVVRGRPAIVDFKQSIKPKRYEWITDYFHQLSAYAMAHDIVYGTNINFGVVMIAVQDGTTQEFTTTGRDFERQKEEWMERVEKFLATRAGT